MFLLIKNSSEHWRWSKFASSQLCKSPSCVRFIKVTDISEQLLILIVEFVILLGVYTTNWESLNYLNLRYLFQLFQSAIHSFDPYFQSYYVLLLYTLVILIFMYGKKITWTRWFMSTYHEFVRSAYFDSLCNPFNYDDWLIHYLDCFNTFVY